MVNAALKALWPSRSTARPEAPPQPEQPEAVFQQPVRTIAIWGPAGAPGKSTLALNLADTLARAGKRTLLIDADLVSPSLALLLGANDQTSGISAACKLAREAKLDIDELKRVTLKVDAAGASFCLLPGISGASRWPEITPSSVETLLRVASGGFDVAIFDLASSLEPALTTPAAAIGRNELTRYIVANTDVLLAVSHPDAVGVHRMLRQILDVQKLRSDGAVKLVINRVRDSVASGTVERQLAETFESLVKISPAYFLPNDPSNTDAAVRAGVPVRLIKRRGPLARAIKSLAEDLRV